MLFFGIVKAFLKGTIMQAISAVRMASELVRRRVALGQSAPTNLELQKLAYFCHGWHLALLDTPLVDEEFEAWRFGPVLPSIYHKFKVFASNPIPVDHPLVTGEQPLDVNSSTSKVITRVLTVYGKASGFKLVDLSHVEGGPWAKAWSPDVSSSTIDNASIKSFFKEQAERTKAKAKAAA
jgi:uncharacterized phage-associated protein